MPKGKQIGNTFERKCAKLILQAAGPGFTKKDCYRVPQSGGHPFLSSGDLEVSTSLCKVMPFTIECKHRKTFKPLQFFKPTAEIRAYLDQVVPASIKDKRCPLVITMGRATAIFIIFRPEDIKLLPPPYKKLMSYPGLEFTHKNTKWRATLFTRFLRVLRKLR